MLDTAHLRLLIYDFHQLARQDWCHPLLQSHFWRCYMNDRAGGSIEYAGQRQELLPNELYLIPPGTQFSTHLTEAIGHFFIHFDLLRYPYQLEGFARPAHLVTPPHLVAATQAAIGEIQQGHDKLLLQLRLKAILYEAILLYFQTLPLELIKRYMEDLEAVGPLSPAFHYIEAHLDETLPNTLLANLCHMSPDYFIRCFRRSTDRTPVRYIQEQRVKQAEQQLLLTDLTLEQIAAALGFGSRAYFTRVFTRHTGVPPATYRHGRWSW